MATAFAFFRTSIVLGAAIVGAAVTSIAILSAAGFGAAGVAAGSFAAWWQSTYPLVPARSVFAFLTSAVMRFWGMM
jgi:hypothetical protein